MFVVSTASNEPILSLLLSCASWKNYVVVAISTQKTVTPKVFDENYEKIVCLQTFKIKVPLLT